LLDRISNARLNSVRTGVFLKLAQILRDLGHPMATAMASIARDDS